MTVDVVAAVLVLATALLMAVSLVFLASGIDDLFIDLCFLVRSAYRRLFVLSRHAPLTEEALRTKEEQFIAVMLPAWDESAVIRPMLLNTVRNLGYTNFRIFVGTYPNDAATRREVGLVREACDKVECIVTPHDGPTNKADCLNWIYQGIRRYEEEHGIRFEIFVMQDCEDVIHPLCYKLFNHLIPRKDMVQLPVMALEPKWHQFTSGHYIDEFAQLHYKDLVVREMLNRSLPAAGVGVAFSRRALEAVAAGNRGQIFSVDSLTEDYDFGFRLKQHGMKQIFVRFPVTREETRRHWLTGRERRVKVRDVVCIREFFPASFKASMRQKSRWVVGITLQGWANLGWMGGLATRYMLFRDRKSLLTNLVNLLGYLVVAVVVSVWIAIELDPEAYRYPPLLERDSWLWYVILANAGLLGWRVSLRAWCVYRLYGVRQAVLSVPRMVWGNVINFAATCRAIRLYLNYLRTGKPIGWDKTAHVFPDESQLQRYRRRLGDLLLERRLVSAEQLASALERQKQRPGRLGEILKDMGVVQERDLAAVLQGQ